MTVLLGPEITFAGGKAEQALAHSVFALLSGLGRFMAYDTPLRMSASAISEYLHQHAKKATANAVVKMAEANSEVFAIESVEGETWLVTTRAGKAPVTRKADLSHSFGERFFTPEPKPEGAEMALRPRQRGDSVWAPLERLERDLQLPSIDDVIDASLLTVPTEIQIVEALADLVEPEVEEPGIARTITVTSVPTTDVTNIDDIELASAIHRALGADARVANFGELWMPEEQVPRFSRNDLRKMKDYIDDQEQPLTDETLVQDVLGVRPQTTDFESTRFALNYRLAKDRDFTFAGTSNQRFWSVSSLAPIGTVRRKATDIGTDYRYLTETGVTAEPRSATSVDHLLTFYEYGLGLLPFDAEMQALMPTPVTEGQRSAVLTFDCPQAFTTYLVELRYPAPNRGGFIVGLDGLYERLVPGALISIHATENDGHYRVEYAVASKRSERLLELDERKQRYHFRPTSFDSAVMEDHLLTEEIFGGFANERPLDDKARRRPENVLSSTFERIGRKMDGPGYTATFTELFVGANVERPFSEELLRTILDTDESGAFAPDPENGDTYTYVPSITG